MYHFLRRSKVPFKNAIIHFPVTKKIAAWAASRRMNEDAYIVVYLMPSTFPRIGMILDEFRFAASGVSWKMGPIYIAKICKYLRKLVVFSISFGLLKEPCFCGFLWWIVVWYSQAEPGAATAPLSPAAKWLGITFELQHSSKRFAFCFNQIAWYDTRMMWCGVSRGRKYTTWPKPVQVLLIKF